MIEEFDFACCQSITFSIVGLYLLATLVMDTSLVGARWDFGAVSFMRGGCCRRR